MKKLFAGMLAVLVLVGCKGSDKLMNQAITLRQNIENAKQCVFECTITADYGDSLHTFSLDCVFAQDGSLQFNVVAPESIASITGQIDASNGKLVFDGHILAFPLLADGYISPVCAPWLLMKTLRGGYIDSCAATEQGICITLEDTFQKEALTALVWVREDQCPSRAEFIWDGRRILTVEIRNFSLV